MTPVALDGFLNKKEIESSYGRSYRSLTRDITRAVKAGDGDVLRHLKLITEDDTVREGTDVTLKMIQDLSNHGLRPMWIAEETWIADWCSRRSGQRRGNAERTKAEPDSRSTPPSPSNDSGPAATASQSVPVEFLQQRIEDQKQQINMLRGQLQIKDEQLRTANQLAEQSQQLMRDLHVLLKNVQDGLLGEGSRPLIGARTATPKSTESAPQSVVQRPAPAVQRTPRRPAKSSPSKKKAKRSTVAEPAADQAAAGRLQRWFPTFLGPKGRGK